MGVGRARAACPRQGHRFSSSLPLPLLAGEAAPVAAATGFQPQEEGERTMAYIRYQGDPYRSDQHTSELQPLMRISYTVFCLQTTKPPHTRDHLSETQSHDTKDTTKPN